MDGDDLLILNQQRQGDAVGKVDRTGPASAMLGGAGSAPEVPRFLRTDQGAIHSQLEKAGQTIGVTNDKSRATVWVKWAECVFFYKNHKLIEYSLNCKNFTN